MMRVTLIFIALSSSLPAAADVRDGDSVNLFEARLSGLVHRKWQLIDREEFGQSADDLNFNVRAQAKLHLHQYLYVGVQLGRANECYTENVTCKDPDEAYLTGHFATIATSVGKLHVPQAGWKGYFSNDLLLKSEVLDLPFDEYQPAGRLDFSSEKSLYSLFVTRDVTNEYPQKGEFTERLYQPTWIVELRQRNCDHCLLVQIGNYDLNHSQFVVLGLASFLEWYQGYLDVRIDGRDRKYGREKKRSYIGAASFQSDVSISEHFGIYLKASILRQLRRGYDREQIANRKGQVDQNLETLFGALTWTPQASLVRLYAGFDFEQARFYNKYPDDLDIQSASRWALMLGATFAVSMDRKAAHNLGQL